MNLFTRLIVALLAAIVLVSCSSGADGQDAVDEAPAADYDDAGGEAGEEAADAESGDGSSRGPGESSSAERMVITTADASLVADDPAAAVNEIARQTEALGGHVEARDQRADDDGRVESAEITARAPADGFGELTEALEDLGELRHFNQSAVDVTGTARDLDARITAAQTSVERLLEIMSQANSTSDLITIETSLSERQAQLEQLQAERNRLGDQVSLSTLSVYVTSEPTAEVQADGFLGGLQSGWNALVSFINGALVVTGALLPFAVAIGLPAILLAGLLRRRGHRRRAGQSPAEDRLPAWESEAHRSDAAQEEVPPGGAVEAPPAGQARPEDDLR